MTSEPDNYSDRVYRSTGAMVGGALLLALIAWLGGDALVRGSGRSPFIALAVVCMLAPLIVAFSLRPAVFANPAGVRIRNPFRTVVVPWSRVETVRAGYSCELVAEGVTYQLWSIPVSLRARSRANRHNQRLAAGEQPKGAFGIGTANTTDTGPRSAPSDAAVSELKEMAEQNRERAKSEGQVTVTWAYELIAPAALGAVAVLVLWLSA
ncbi:PH domain-containing protein [Streptomyces bohaiensis]|uniref:PH domain-containing protein n=1 Tax=Streptomyces bohaiensis TaxID=1431344 RepID=A0ABX1CC17_9ACTN|nr:PH domain-containing protein [Streptomyces bohaiensis]NJQ15821.1 PH domain-containing protein [Streptomyces bohaiensis]